MSRLNPDLQDKYKLALANAALELTTGEALPVDIERVCTKLQVEQVRKIDGYRTARLAGKSKIYLPSALLPSPGCYNAMERYLIAHEIGHHVLTSLFSVTPLGKSEYWQFEDLCNGFARQLLIPETALSGLPNLVRSPEEALALASSLASDAFVPWPTAAWRVSERYPSLVLLYVIVRRSHSAKLSMRVSASTSPRKQIQQKVLDMEAGLGLILRPLTEGKEAISFCEDDTERAEIMAELPALGEVGRAYAMRSRGGIRVAIHRRG